jgi:hypothetical protein
VKNFSLPRMAIILWFLNYTFLSLTSYAFNPVRHLISGYIIYATVMMAVELICLGLIEDIAK